VINTIGVEEEVSEARPIYGVEEEGKSCLLFPVRQRARLTFQKVKELRCLVILYSLGFGVPFCSL
jgi:hypothetical protein